MLKVGIVGSGFMGGVHTNSWAQTPAQIVGIASKDKESAQKLAAQVGAKVYDSLDSLLNEVDAVDICAPTHLHHEMVLQAAAAGKHIICEKPLARTLIQAEAMLKACQKAGVTLLVAHVVRFFPQYAAAKATVDRGEIGRVAVVRLSRCSFKPKGGADGWFHDTSKSGGMMLDLMIHDYDYARWVAGEVENVFAKSVASKNPKAAGDYALAILKHKNGALSHVEGAWAYPPPLFRTALEIAGDRGLIELPAEGSAPLGIYLQQDKTGDEPDIAVPSSPLAEDPYATEIKHFYEVLVNQAAPRLTAEDGLESLRIGLAALQSAQTGRPVKLAEVK